MDNMRELTNNEVSSQSTKVENVSHIVGVSNPDDMATHPKVLTPIFQDGINWAQDMLGGLIVNVLGVDKLPILRSKIRLAHLYMVMSHKHDH